MMDGPRRRHRSDRTLRTLLLAATVVFAPQESGAAPAGPAFAPPDEMPAACREPAHVDLGGDWSTWRGEPTGRSREDLIAIAGEYAVGGARVARDPDIAARILDHLRSSGPDDADIAAVDARRLLATGDTDDRGRAEILLRTAAASGSRAAWRLLGDLLASTDPATALEAYRESAAAGDARAAVDLARLVARRDPSSVQTKMAILDAFTSILLAIDGGDCRAIRLMIALYTDGDLVEPRRDLADAWTRRAADLGDAGAALRLARDYRFGRGVEPDEARAVHYLEIAARGGRISALFPLGMAYATGEGVARDPAKAADYLERSAKAGREGAWAVLAQLHRGEFGGPPALEKAHAALVEAAAEQSAGAVVFLELGRAHLEGWGVPADPATAIAHFTRASELGSSAGAFEAARLLENGAEGLGPDIGRALRLHRLAAAGGSAPAAARLARIYFCGSGVERSLKKAATWQERAAFLGSSSSMRVVARKMMVSDDPSIREQGFLLLRQSAKRGDLDSVAAMALMYETGGAIVAADADVSARWIDHGSRVSPRAGVFEAALAKAHVELGGTDELATAERLFRLAIDAGLVEARYDLARTLDLADLAAKDDLIELLLPLARESNVGAMRKLGELLEPGASAGGRTGRDWLAAAAATGDLAALLRLSEDTAGEALREELERIDASGLACDADDFAKVAQGYLRLGEDGHTDALRFADFAARTVGATDGSTLMSIASVLIAASDAPEDAQRLLERAVTAGEPKAPRVLAEGLASGRFGPADPAAASQVLLAGGDAGDRDSDIAFLRLVADGTIAADGVTIGRVMNRLGSDLESMSGDVLKIASRARDGVFGPTGTALARAWLETAAASGRVAAMRMLADIALYGAASERNPEEGLAWLRKAADAGDREALRTLSAAYDVGFVVAVDRDLARDLRARSQRSVEPAEGEAPPAGSKP